MIDPIDDDPDDPTDVPESEGPSWFERPILPRGEMLALIEERRKVDGRAVNLFRNGSRRY
jgi:hypothetical protein